MQTYKSNGENGKQKQRDYWASNNEEQLPTQIVKGKFCTLC